jgi:predicted nucleic acid-binding protein
MAQVVDASTVVAALIDSSPDGQWCEAQLAADELVAPDLMPYEVANILRRTEARGAIDTSTAAGALADLRTLAIELVAFDLVADRIWALRANLTVYDASYVATAELVGGRLVTLDRKLAGAPGIRCPIALAP